MWRRGAVARGGAWGGRTAAPGAARGGCGQAGGAGGQVRATTTAYESGENLLARARTSARAISIAVTRAAMRASSGAVTLASRHAGSQRAESMSERESWFATGLFYSYRNDTPRVRKASSQRRDALARQRFNHLCWE